jgi:hypothetical protein
LFLGAASAVPAWAAWTSSITGRVTEVRLFTPDAGIAAQTVWFSLANMPTTACPNNGSFAFSPANVTDPQTLKNFLALLMSAQATGASVTVGYDSGSSCDPSGYPRIYELVIAP